MGLRVVTKIGFDCDFPEPHCVLAVRCSRRLSAMVVVLVVHVSICKQMSVEGKEEEKNIPGTRDADASRASYHRFIAVAWRWWAPSMSVVPLLRRLRPLDVFFYRWSGHGRGRVSRSSSLSSS